MSNNYIEGQNMRPEPLPVLKGKSAKEFMKQVAKPLSQKDLETFKKAERVFKGIKPAK